MSLEEAIKHLDDVIKNMECSECKNEHIQLREWLLELQNYKNGNIGRH